MYENAIAENTFECWVAYQDAISDYDEEEIRKYFTSVY